MPKEEKENPFEKALRDIGEWNLASLFREGGFSEKEIIVIGIKKLKGGIEKLKEIEAKFVPKKKKK